MSGQNWFPPLDPTEFADEVDTGEQTPDTDVHSEPESENPDEESEPDSLLDHAETVESEPVSTGNAPSAEETVVAAVSRPTQHLTPTFELADEDETGSATDPVVSESVGVVRTLPVVTLAVSDLNTQPDWASEWELPATDPEPTPTIPDEGERIGIPEPLPGSDRARGRSRRTKAAVGGAAAAVLAVLVGGTAIALASGSDEPDAPASLEVPGTTTLCRRRGRLSPGRRPPRPGARAASRVMSSAGMALAVPDLALMRSSDFSTPSTSTAMRTKREASPLRKLRPPNCRLCKPASMTRPGRH
ncbi:hypothetical protein EN35_23170 [Rhodococcus qingshengii]|nr:hypothetical protein EN35_23170 [Rhodococcus qingshengii]